MRPEGRTGAPPGPWQQGFTLLEILVALIIFAIAFGAVAAIFQTALRQSTSAETLMAATAVAERQLARFGTELPLTTGRSSGLAEEGLRWQADIALASPPRADAGSALYRVSVAVGSADGATHYLTLDTLRLGASP